MWNDHSTPFFFHSLPSPPPPPNTMDFNEPSNNNSYPNSRITVPPKLKLKNSRFWLHGSWRRWLNWAVKLCDKHLLKMEINTRMKCIWSRRRKLAHRRQTQPPPWTSLTVCLSHYDSLVSDLTNHRAICRHHRRHPPSSLSSSSQHRSEAPTFHVVFLVLVQREYNEWWKNGLGRVILW